MINAIWRKSTALINNMLMMPVLAMPKMIAVKNPPKKVIGKTICRIRRMRPNVRPTEKPTKERNRYHEWLDKVIKIIVNVDHDHDSVFNITLNEWDDKWCHVAHLIEIDAIKWRTKSEYMRVKCTSSCHAIWLLYYVISFAFLFSSFASQNIWSVKQTTHRHRLQEVAWVWLKVTTLIQNAEKIWQVAAIEFQLTRAARKGMKGEKN